jgi:phosphomannomutase/phosphoglucomutase
VAGQDASLDELLADLPVAVSTPEILIPVSEEEKFPLIQRFVEQARFPEGKPLTLDGLRVDFSDGWGLLRASNTSPALTARFEARDEAALATIMGNFREQLSAVAPSLDIPF